MKIDEKVSVKFVTCVSVKSKKAEAVNVLRLLTMMVLDSNFL